MPRPSRQQRTDRAPPDDPLPPRHSTSVRVLRNFGGVLLLLLGIVGLFLPILQGLLFIAIGLTLIDLPIKHRAHLRLSRYGWYRRVAHYHDVLLAKWRARRARRRGDGPA